MLAVAHLRRRDSSRRSSRCRIAYLPYIARVLRSGAIRERSLPYIDACYAEGLPTRSIALRHLLPNIMPLVLVQATLSFGYALVDLAAISYLGLGVQPPHGRVGPDGRQRAVVDPRRPPAGVALRRRC